MEKSVFIVKKAEGLIKAIEKHIGFCDWDSGMTGMIQYSRPYYDPEYVDVHAPRDVRASPNTALALAYLFNGQKEKGKRLVHDIEEHIGFEEHLKFKRGWFHKEKGLVKSTSYLNSMYYTFDSAFLALAYLVCGEREKGKSLIEIVEEYKDKRTGLIRRGLYEGLYIEGEIDTNANTMLALAYLGYEEKEKGKRLIDAIEEYIGFDEKTGLVNFGLGNSKLITHPNALLAWAYFAYEKREKGEGLLKAIEKYIGFHKPSGLIKAGVKNSGLQTLPNASLALAYGVKEA